MDLRALQQIHLVSAVVFVAAVLVLAVQLITPSPVVVSVGDAGAETTRVGRYFTYPDVAVSVVAAFCCGASATHLVLHGQAPGAPTWSAKPPSTDRSTAAANGGVETSDGEPGRRPGEREPPRERWEATVERLQNNEETVYSLLVEADGELPQRELVEETDLSKATVSRTLDTLEHRDLVERKRNGMGNTIRLQ